MKIFNFFKKDEKKRPSGRFSDFFLNASEDEKKVVFKEAARRANEEQRQVFLKSRFKTKTN